MNWGKNNPARLPHQKAGIRRRPPLHLWVGLLLHLVHRFHSRTNQIEKSHASYYSNEPFKRPKSNHPKYYACFSFRYYDIPEFRLINDIFSGLFDVITDRGIVGVCRFFLLLIYGQFLILALLNKAHPFADNFIRTIIYRNSYLLFWVLLKEGRSERSNNQNNKNNLQCTVGYADRLVRISCISFLITFIFVRYRVDCLSVFAG